MKIPTSLSNSLHTIGLLFLAVCYVAIWNYGPYFITEVWAKTWLRWIAPEFWCLIALFGPIIIYHYYAKYTIKYLKDYLPHAISKD